MHRILNGEVGIKAEQYITTRSSDKQTRGNSRRIQRKLIKKDVHKYSFFHRTAADWNELDEKTAVAETRELFEQHLQGNHHEAAADAAKETAATKETIAETTATETRELYAQHSNDRPQEAVETAATKETIAETTAAETRELYVQHSNERPQVAVEAAATKETSAETTAAKNRRVLCTAL